MKREERIYAVYKEKYRCKKERNQMRDNISNRNMMNKKGRNIKISKMIIKYNKQEV